MSRTNPERCIYRVSDTMRDVKPEAYRPRMALIGLRNRSANPGVAKDGAGTSNDPGYEYTYTILSLTMEHSSVVEIEM